MFLLHFRYLADVMFFAGTNDHHRNARENSGAPPKGKSHNAAGRVIGLAPKVQDQSGEFSCW